MSLRDKLGEYVPLLARKPSLPREQSLALKPIRNPSITWERAEVPEDDAPMRLVLRVPIKSSRLSRLFTRVLSMPDSKTIELDEFGSSVWEMCDGQHTVEQFAVHTAEQYRLNRRQAEVSVLAFMRMLLQRRLIGFIAAPLKGATHVGSNRNPGPARKRGQRARRARRGH